MKTDAVVHSGTQTPQKTDLITQKTPGSDARGKKKWISKSKNRTKGDKKFKPFEDYLSFEEVSEGLKRKWLLKGTLRINPKNFEESYIDSEDGGADILISGLRARNRALEGDIVAVQLLEESAWKLLDEEYKSHQRKCFKEVQTSSPASSEAEVDPKRLEDAALAGQLQSLEFFSTRDEVLTTGAVDHKVLEDLGPGNSSSVFRVSGTAAMINSAARTVETECKDNLPRSSTEDEKISHDATRDAQTQDHSSGSPGGSSNISLDVRSSSKIEKDRPGSAGNDATRDHPRGSSKEDAMISSDDRSNAKFHNFQSVSMKEDAVSTPNTERSVKSQDHSLTPRSNDKIGDHLSESLKKDCDHVAKKLFSEDAATANLERTEEGEQSNRRVEDSNLGEEEDKLIPVKSFQKQGKVVYIIEKKHSRASSGFLKPPGTSTAPDALFAPTDHRVPRIYIPLSECPDDFLKRPGDFEKTLFIARIQDWPKTSVYAKGHLQRSLGEAGEIEPETEAMLIENEIDCSDFSDEVLNCLPNKLEWTISQDELAKRRDFRSQCVFTIDPSTARDLDDALSCTQLEDGVYEVGVHIADVSFFVEEDNALDSVASSRATSVYLVQKVIPMLPRLLCENLCSLNANVDKLTFSFLWKLSETGEILDEWCGRSVIHSCVKMSYDHAQDIIDHPDREWGQQMPQIGNGFTIADVANGILNLNKIAQNLRRQRTEDGALRLDQVKLQFALNRGTGLPSGYSVYKQKDSNRLVEEFMLLANMAAAHRIYEFNRKTAILRRHPPPKQMMMDSLIDTCSTLGLEVDGSSSKAIQESISRYLGPRDDLEAWGRGQILTVLYSRPMQRAKYFCTGTLDDETLYCHYALNVPLYTHFTSPIRRYADIMVHRQLAGSLGLGPVSERDEIAVQEQAMRCNDRKEAAKKVSDMSSEMFFAIFVRECGPLEADAMVMKVLDYSMDVLALSLGVVKRVYCNALPLKSFKFVKEGKVGKLTLVWKADEKHPNEQTQIIQLFSLVKVELQAANEPLKITATLKHPDVTQETNVGEEL